MSPIRRRQTLTVKGARLRWPRLIGLRGDTMVVVEGRDLALVFTGVGSNELRTTQVQLLQWAPSWVRVSPSGKYFLLESPRGNYVQVMSSEANRIIGELSGPESVHVAFSSIGGKDVIVSSPRAGILEGITLPDMEIMFQADCTRPKPFVFDRVETMSDLDSLAVVGHTYFDPLDRLALFQVSELLAAPDMVAETVRADPAVLEGDQLILGHGEEAEVPVLVHSDDPAVADEVVISSLTGGKVQRLSLPRIEDPLVRLLLTRQVVAVARTGGVTLLPRKAGAAAETISTVVVGFDASGPRLVHWPGEGELELVELAD